MNITNPPGLQVNGARAVGEVVTATSPTAADWEFTNGTYPPPPAPGTTFSIHSNGGSNGGPPGGYTSPFASAPYGAGEMPSSNDPWSVMLFINAPPDPAATHYIPLLTWGQYAAGVVFWYKPLLPSLAAAQNAGGGDVVVPDLFDGATHCIIWTFDGSDRSTWVDDVLIERGPFAFAISAAANEIHLGTDTITANVNLDKDPFAGYVDELAIFGYCLTDAQVQKLFQAGANIYAAEQDLSPIHAWHFDETAFPCADWAGNSPMVAGTGGNATPTVTFHQTPLAGATYVPPQGNLNGLTVSGVPSTGQELVATSPTTANWQTPPASGVSQIVPGARMTVSPGGGTGVVTVDAAPTAVPVVFADSPYTPASNESLWLLCDTTGGPIVINLPAASTDGDQIDIVNLGSGIDTVDATAFGLGSLVIPDAAVSVRYFAAGPAWFSVGPSCAFNAASPDGTTIQVVNGVASVIGGGGGTGGSAIYGDGSDGAITASNTTLTADVNATTYHVPAGVTVVTANFAIHATTSATIDSGGVVDNSGGDGDSGTLGGGGGQSAPAAVFADSTQGGDGGNGSAGLDGSSGTGLASPGGAGGAGDAYLASAGGVSSVPGNVGSNQRSGVSALVGATFVSCAPNAINAGNGGGGGAGDVAGTHVGGGGGAGGGYMLIAAPTITNNGTISAKGGAGGAGEPAGNTGGGGGGAGGQIVTVGTFTGNNPDVSGGLKGLKGGSGSDGTDGGAGAWVNLAESGGGGGTSQLAPVAKTTTYGMAAADSGVLADATSAGFTVTLPVTPTAGQTYFVKKVDATANVVTIAGASGNIDGAATATISVQYQSLAFVWDGANWWLAG